MSSREVFLGPGEKRKLTLLAVDLAEGYKHGGGRSFPWREPGTPFHLTRNELEVANSRRDDWHLLRVWNFARRSQAFALRPPLEAHLDLLPTSFIARLQ